MSIEALHETIGMIEARDRPSVLRATLEMVAACFHPEDLSGTHYRRGIFRRVEEHMREHLLDAVLTPPDIASYFGISTRYLHRPFAEAGVTFSQWVRKEKLARAKNALANQSFSADSITQIAHRFGFYDAAHFSNAFRASYGM